MRRAARLLSITVAVIPAFAGDVPGVREYEEGCVTYYAHQYGVSAALVRTVIQVSPPFDRRPVFGFRCVIYVSPVPHSLEGL
jgi:hypothetical protein